MIQKIKKAGESGLGKSVFLGCVTSIAVTVIISMIIAALVESEKIPVESTGYGVMVMLICASYTGGYVTSKKMGRQALTSSLLCGATFLAVLLSMNAVLFEGSYSGVGETVLLILCGCSVAAMWISRTKKRMKVKKVKIQNR